MNPTFLYRLYDADGALLYIGITRRPKGRFLAHAGEKAWWADVATHRFEEVEATSAGEIERAAIMAELPRYNVRHGQAERVQRLSSAGVPVPLRLPRSLHAALQQRATAEDRSMAATIRQACKDYIERGEK